MIIVISKLEKCLSRRLGWDLTRVSCAEYRFWHDTSARLSRSTLNFQEHLWKAFEVFHYYKFLYEYSNIFERWTFFFDSQLKEGATRYFWLHSPRSFAFFQIFFFLLCSLLPASFFLWPFAVLQSLWSLINNQTREILIPVSKLFNSIQRTKWWQTNDDKSCFYFERKWNNIIKNEIKYTWWWSIGNEFELEKKLVKVVWSAYCSA